MLDVPHKTPIFRGHEGEGVTHLRGAARTADPVRVGVDGVGHVVVDHMGYAGNVDPPRGDVGGHQDLVLPVAKAAQCILAPVLREIALQRGDRQAGPLHLLGHARRAVLRAGEDEDRFRIRLVEQFHQQGRLEMRRHRIDGMGNRGYGNPGADPDDDGVAEHLPGQLPDVVRHRGGEKQRLPILRQPLDDPADVRQKAHVEHAVRLIQNQHLNTGKVDFALFRQIEQASRTGDRDFDPLTERPDLGIFIHPPVNGDAFELRRPPQPVNGLMDLFGQLPRRGDDQRADDLPRAVHQPL